MSFWSKLSRRRRNSLLIVVVVLLIGLLQLSPPPTRTPTAYFTATPPLVIAHQGGNHLRPGNTMAAFEHARGLGADVLEMDLHMSRDGTVVVIHDATVDRTTNGTGAVSALTLAELVALDAGFHWPLHDSAAPLNGHPYRGEGLTIPTLEAVLRRFDQVRLLLEIKQAKPPMEAVVCAQLTEANRLDDVVVASFHHDVLASFRELCPTVATGASSREVAWFLRLQTLELTRMFRAPALVLHLPARREDTDLLDEAVVRAAQQWGLATEFWTINDRDGMRRAIRAGAHGVMTDRPDLLLDELGRMPAP